MRVLQIYDHLGVSSGVTSVLMSWLRAVDRASVQFDFLVGYHREPSYEAEVQQLGGKIFYMSDSKTFGPKQLPDIVRNVKAFMKAHAQEYDAVHLHTATFSYPYLYYAKKYGAKRRICHIHGAQLGRTWFTGLRNLLMVLPLKTLANEYLACSKGAGERYCPALRIKKFHVILNGLDMSRYEMDETVRCRMREELGVGEDTFLVCHVSNMTEIKNVPFAVRVFAQIAKERPDSRLLLIGRTPLPAEVQKQIQLCGLEGKVISLGIRRDVPELLHAADVCLMPSKTEGLGIVAVESQAAGTPVITSTGFPEEVYATELAVPVEFDERLWAEIALKQKRREPVACREALEKFDINCIAKQISDYYSGG